MAYKLRYGCILLTGTCLSLVRELGAFRKPGGSACHIGK
jgi:hypothetical protein